MFGASQQKGFTLLELLIVIAIIGILSAVVVVTSQASRVRARNAAVLSQIDQYQKALELHYSSSRSFPSNWTGANRNRVVCIGAGTLDCLGGVSFGTPPQATYYDEVETALAPNIGSFPTFVVGTFSSPAYSGCASPGPSYVWNAASNVCTNQHYSLWFLLEGANQSCGRARVADAGFSGGQYTLCRLQNLN